MKYLVSILPVLASFAAGAQVQSNCYVPPNLAAAYEDDVKGLALQRIYEIQSPDTAIIDIPPVHTDSIWRGLAAIFNLDTALEADSVFRYHCIHTDDGGKSPIMRNVYLTIDTNYSWTKQWKNLTTTTGYGALDSFVSRYGFTISSYWQYPMSGVTAGLTTTQVINARAFADSISVFSGVINATASGFNGDGKGLITYKKDTQQHYSFRIGWGDCMAGCPYKKIWNYVVNSDHCNVTYDTILSVSDPSDMSNYPLPVNCNLVPTEVRELHAVSRLVTVYPNPVMRILNIEVETGEAITYEITDPLGKVVGSGLTKTGAIDVADLSPGVYLLQIKGRSNGRFLKL